MARPLHRMAGWIESCSGCGTFFWSNGEPYCPKCAGRR